MPITQLYRYPPSKVGRRYGAFNRTLTTIQTQTAVARISGQTTKTQTAVCNISGGHTVGKITQFFRRTRTGQRYLTTTRFTTIEKIQTALAKITQSPVKDQTAVARIKAPTLRTQISLARIRAQTTRTQTAVANLTVTATTTVTVDAVASIIATGSHNVGKITQFYRRMSTGRRYGSFASKATPAQTTRTQTAKGAVKVTVTISGSQTLAWDATAGATGYKLYVGTSSGVYTYPGSPIDVGNVLTYQVTLLPTNTYYFAVTAYNAVGESGFSNEIVIFIHAGLYAKGRIVFQGLQTQTAKGQIKTTVLKTQNSIANVIFVSGTQTRTQTAIASILHGSVDQTITAVCQIVQRVEKPLNSVARIGQKPVKTQTAKATISGQTIRKISADCLIGTVPRTTPPHGGDTIDGKPGGGFDLAPSLKIRGLR